MSANHQPRIAIVAGEASGDLLAADLIKALREYYPQARFFGIAGPLMQGAGCKVLYPMERISVMGIAEVISHLFVIIKIRRRLLRHLKKYQPDLYIGIDYTEFNLSMAGKLKAHGIKTVQYKSPSVWAWRRRRLKRMSRAIDLLLCVFPFEKVFFAKHNFPANYIGHPLADAIPMKSDQKRVRERLDLSPDAKIIALLPGSRQQEIKYLGALFIQTAQWCWQQRPELSFVVPAINQQTRQYLQRLQKEFAPDVPMKFYLRQSQDLMRACDAILLASGTASLEAMLLRKPMVVAYKMTRFSYFLAKCLVSTPHISLPNLLADEELVPEFIQEEAQIEPMGRALLRALDDKEYSSHLNEVFAKLHDQLRCDASQRAAEAIKQLVGDLSVAK